MAGETDVLVRFIGDTTKLRDDVNKLSNTGKTMKKWAIGVGAAVGGAFAVGKVVSFGKAAFGAAVESEKATARLAQVFKSMGDETGEAAKAAEDYANSLSKQIGVDDDVIKGGQAILATFGNVSGEAGRAAGIFDRATKAGADLAAAGFGSISSNAVQLGKALNDPIKGVTVLAKSGVTFTEQQKEQIKTMVESGDVLGAQKIVLGELEKQVGGVAEATATGGDKMSVVFGEVQESIGKALMPIVNVIMPLVTKAFEAAGPLIEDALKGIQDIARDVVAWFVANWPKIQAVALDVFRAVRDAVMPIVQAIADFVVGTLLPAFGKIWDAILKAAPDVLEVFKSIGSIAEQVFPKIVTVLEKITPVLGAIIVKLIQFVGWLARNKELVLALVTPILAYIAAMKTWAIIQAVVRTATLAWATAQGILNGVLTANPIGLVIAAIVALVAGIIWAYQNVSWFHDGIDKLWQIIQVAFDAILNIVKGVLDWISNNWKTLLAILTGPIGAAVLIITKNWDTIKEAVMGVFNWIKDNWQTLLAIFTGPIGIATKLIIDNFNEIKSAITGVYDWIKEKVEAIAGVIEGVISGVKTAVGKIVDAIKVPINAIIGGMNALEFTIPKIEINPPGPGSISAGPWHIDVLPDIPELATGGLVTATGLAMVHRGETFSGVGGGMGQTFNINIDVKPGTDPAQTGRAVVELIRAYERANGRKVLT